MHTKIYRVHKRGVSLKEISELLGRSIGYIYEQYELGCKEAGVKSKRLQPENYIGKEKVWPWGAPLSKRYLLQR